MAVILIGSCDTITLFTHTHTRAHTHTYTLIHTGTCTHTHTTHTLTPHTLTPLNTQAKEEEEKALHHEWDRRRVTEAKAGLVLQSQDKKKQKQLALKLAEENRQLAAEQRAR